MTDKIPARQRLLNAAAELFYRDGVGATGIDAITAHAGVAKMSLYNNFASKADLVHAYIEGRRREWHELLAERLKMALTPKERVLAVFDSYTDHAAFAYEWGFRGCGLLNAAAELPIGDLGRASVAAQKDEVEELFKKHLHKMRPADTATDETAEHLSFLLEGAMSRAGLDGHDGRLKTARKIAVSMLDQLESQSK
ncbi:TetR/AcrR family transcriptional regulator [Pseudaminobacter soli (ex Li et al. 2025)]|uniref:TetR/AcrR family transcriptional regulator n=1 Tax=Pseudaminobacter soli (ex Li et al. 2025) TaxID=1295366 RepID=A0A2P7RZP7_9HYPH|nr:TetR/AcrR family transcriptional regulator [Mesorhizobium soli]PSJ55646.1 TetR/AcrR family transcriptional regulator [Mesorhizobium soli]